jgi:hypothetical protein
VIDAEKRGYHDVEASTSIDRVLPAESPKRVLEVSIPPLFSPHGDTYSWAGKRRLNPKKPDAMSDRYSQIFEDLTRDLYAVAKRHGKRALREAVRDAARGELLQEEEDDESIPPEELGYPDEDVWTLPPPPDERDENGDEQSTDDELSDAAENVLSDLMDRLKKKAEK